MPLVIYNQDFFPHGAPCINEMVLSLRVLSSAIRMPRRSVVGGGIYSTDQDRFAHVLENRLATKKHRSANGLLCSMCVVSSPVPANGIERFPFYAGILANLSSNLIKVFQSILVLRGFSHTPVVTAMNCCFLWWSRSTLSSRLNMGMPSSSNLSGVQFLFHLCIGMLFAGYHRH